MAMKAPVPNPISCGVGEASDGEQRHGVRGRRDARGGRSVYRAVLCRGSGGKLRGGGGRWGCDEEKWWEGW